MLGIVVPKQKFDNGQLFSLTLNDSTKLLGIILSIQKKALNSVVCAFSLKKYSDGTENILNEEDLISVQFTTPDLLKNGSWQVVPGKSNIDIERVLITTKINENIESQSFKGVKVIGSGNILKFLNACVGLHPWDGFYEPDYLDKLLLSTDMKPSGIKLKSDFG